MAREHDLCAACGHHRERHHQSCHVFPCTCQRFSDVAPAPTVTPGLLAAAQAVIDAGAGYDEERQRLGYEDQSIALVIHRSAVDALRAELAAATAGPVALTDDEKRQASQRAITIAFRGYGSDKTASDWFNEFVDAFLSDLGDIGYAIVRRPS